jgi:hypothetical protein
LLAEARKQAAANLAFQKWLANEQLRLGQASRTDAYGNAVRYDKALNKWVTELSPMQQRIAKAGEHENLLGLTEDAARNRVVKERAFRRGGQAEEDYNKASAGYRYGQGPSEEAIRDDLTGLIMRARSGQSSGGNTRSFIRQRGNLPVVSGSAEPSDGVSGVAQALLQARQGALGERGTRNQQTSSRYLPAMQQFAATMDAGGDANVQFPNFSGLFNAQDQMANDAFGAMASAGKGVQGAYGLSTKAATSGMPGLGDTTRLIAALRGAPVKGTAATAAPDTRSLDDIIYGF